MLPFWTLEWVDCYFVYVDQNVIISQKRNFFFFWSSEFVCEFSQFVVKFLYLFNHHASTHSVTTVAVIQSAETMWTITCLSNHIYYCMFSFVKLLPNAVISCVSVFLCMCVWVLHSNFYIYFSHIPEWTHTNTDFYKKKYIFIYFCMYVFKIIVLTVA